MLRTFLEQLAFVGASASLVAAILWPHLEPLLSWIWFSIIRGSVIPEHTNDSTSSGRLEQEQNNILEQHPRLSGHSLATTTIAGQRRTSFARPTATQTATNGHSSAGLSSSLLSDGYGRHQWSAVGSLGSPSSSQFVGGTGARQIGGQSSISLVLFTATIVALIIFTLMKLFSAQFIPSARSSDEGDHQSASKHATRRAGGKRQSEYLNNYNARDQRRDRRKLSSREERTRQLILQHGGKSVSKAIRFLISELEKQKQLLVAESSSNSNSNSNSNSTSTIRADSLLTGKDFDDNNKQQDDNSLVDCSCCCNCPCHLISESIDCTTDKGDGNGGTQQRRQQVAQSLDDDDDDDDNS